MEFVITSEDDAYLVLERIKQNEFQDLPDFSVKFDGWPRLDLTIKGEGYNSAITPTIMVGLIEFQKAIYKSYAISKYGTDNIQRLTKEEKSELEIRVTVEKGSSILGIDFQSIAEKFAGNLVTKMTGTELVVVVVGLSVLFFGHSAYRYFLDNRLQVRKEELQTEEQRNSLETLKFASEQETQRTKLIVELAQGNRELQLIREQAFIAQTEMVKSFKDTETAEMSGAKISGELATDLVKNARRPSVDLRLDGIYRVLVVDSSDPTQFRIKVRNVDTQDEFSASVQDDTIAHKYKTAIQEAEWSRSNIKLLINAKDVGGEIRNAVVIIAEAPPAPAP